MLKWIPLLKLCFSNASIIWAALHSCHTSFLQLVSKLHIYSITGRTVLNMQPKLHFKLNLNYFYTPVVKI